jgi:hypothetical protein
MGKMRKLFLIAALGWVAIMSSSLLAEAVHKVETTIMYYEPECGVFCPPPK